MIPRRGIALWNWIRTDAELFGPRGRYRLRLSHNDWIDIFRVQDKRKLQRLGFRVAGEGA